MSILLSITELDSQLKKKTPMYCLYCLAYHILRENIACRVMEPFSIPSAQHYSNFLTKALPALVHEYHTNGILYHVKPDKQLPIGTSG